MVPNRPSMLRSWEWDSPLHLASPKSEICNRARRPALSELRGAPGEALGFSQPLPSAGPHGSVRTLPCRRVREPAAERRPPAPPGKAQTALQEPCPGHRELDVQGRDYALRKEFTERQNSGRLQSYACHRAQPQSA